MLISINKNMKMRMVFLICLLLVLCSCQHIGPGSAMDRAQAISVDDLETIPSPDNQITVDKMTVIEGEKISSLRVGAYNVKPAITKNVKVMSLDSENSKILTDNLVCKDDKNQHVRFTMTSISQEIGAGSASGFHVLLQNTLGVEKGTYTCQFAVVEDNLFVLAKTTAFVSVE